MHLVIANRAECCSTWWYRILSYYAYAVWSGTILSILWKRARKHCTCRSLWSNTKPFNFSPILWNFRMLEKFQDVWASKHSDSFFFTREFWKFYQGIANKWHQLIMFGKHHFYKNTASARFENCRLYKFFIKHQVLAHRQNKYYCLNPRRLPP